MSKNESKHKSKHPIRDVRCPTCQGRGVLPLPQTSLLASPQGGGSIAVLGNAGIGLFNSIDQKMIRCSECNGRAWIFRK